MSGEAGAAALSGRRRVVVLRHGQTGHNAAGIWQGHLDSDLSELGEEQARAAGAALAAYRPSLVVASDLKRAAETGAAVADEAGLALRVDARWREMHVGRWEGLTADEVSAQYPEDRRRHFAGEDFKRGVDGESLSEVVERVHGAVTDLLAELAPGRTAVVATHGVTARVVVSELVGLDLPTTWRVLGGFGNCHWADVVETVSGWRIQTWNASA
ncbi:MAG: histidine phosphatase family protein [Pedococcus sp.]